LNPWKRISSRIPYKNQWIQVREDSVLRPDGTPGIYGVIELRPSVAVVALNHQEEIVLVGQWRYPTGSYTWEVPRGGSHAGETDLLAVAQRELLEETGVVAAEWRELGDLDLCNGVLRSTERVFLAASLRLTPPPVDPTEPLESRWVPLNRAVEMVLCNEIREATSAAAILKAAALLR
jgi:8-oxo-dGTP pyrophosphatase MutT (NUDIX family)